jgi:uncharacterized protein
MGHGDSSEGQCGGPEVSRIAGGFSAVDEQRVIAVIKTRGVRADQGEGRAFKDSSAPESPAPTAEVIKRAAGEPSVAVKAMLAALRIYKVYLSILFAGSCRFEPTCSVYMYQAIERFGVMRGSWMGFERLLRCQPLSRKFGYDPVPEKTKAAPTETGGSEPRAGRAGVAGREAHS